jgi:hypothetical protein
MADSRETLTEAERYRRALKWVLEQWPTYNGQRSPEDIALTIESVKREIYLGAEHAG